MPSKWPDLSSNRAACAVVHHAKSSVGQREWTDSGSKLASTGTKFFNMVFENFASISPLIGIHYDSSFNGEAWGYQHIIFTQLCSRSCIPRFSATPHSALLRSISKLMGRYLHRGSIRFSRCCTSTFCDLKQQTRWLNQYCATISFSLRRRCHRVLYDGRFSLGGRLWRRMRLLL
ncbi:hypothetical protein MPH_13355 [Macrophomina phaseolina MS6]|uniref:Uncharacterized protein n=1 Tax=Macrophomina phaseolina (strain MS6) TaxID=1126212 RepID=K2R5Z9_MACPH|nr:hypothetical protein MPH_13355 [Macrophomina phaseolina MS6]